MKVWIDQELCTGAGLCERLAPSVFAMLDDGLAYVKEGGTVLGHGGPEALGPVAPGAEDAVIEAAEACPAECIYLQTD